MQHLDVERLADPVGNRVWHHQPTGRNRQGGLHQRRDEQLAAEGIAIRVIDLFSVQPIDKETLTNAARATNGLVVTVEDHYAHGGIGDAVLSALATEKVSVHKLAVRGIARSGPSAELLDRFGISARHIVEKVKELAG